MEEVTSIIISLSALLTAITSLLVALNKAKKSIEDSIPKKIKKQCDIDFLIINKMEEVKEFLKADRVQVYDFHNRRTFRKWQKCFKNKLHL